MCVFRQRAERGDPGRKRAVLAHEALPSCPRRTVIATRG